ncbi:MAG TPA: LPS export ABC transporter periplasmic protein LptC [Deltaproteobacteria bacterium]|nr:LPS export ABC transporter periplasmic protein LptC [Deltaproteobacteria bacterium]
MAYRQMKISKKTKIISALVFVLVLVVIATLIAGMSKVRPKGIIKLTPTAVDLEIEGFVYREVGESDSRWEVKAQNATFQRKENLAIFDKLDIKLDSASGKVYTMTADRGKMHTKTRNIEIEGNVVILSNEGDRFTTDYLHYNDEERKFYTDAPVTMENNRIRISGTGLTLFVSSGELNLASAVKAKIK